MPRKKTIDPMRMLHFLVYVFVLKHHALACTKQIICIYIYIIRMKIQGKALYIFYL